MLNIQSLKRIVFCATCLLMSQPVTAEQQSHLGFSNQYIQLKTSYDQPFTVYVAGPENAKQGILLIHGWWGLNQEMEEWANKYSAIGYRVMAIDLYNQQVTTNPVRARALMDGVKQSDANDKYAAAIKSLSAPGRKLAVAGRSFGANQALYAASVAPENVSAIVVYYPFEKVMTDIKILKPIKAPILGHFARHDRYFTPDMLAQFTGAIKTSGLTMKVDMYDAQHAFTNPTGKNFNISAFKLSQQRTNEFLLKYLN